MKTFKIPRAYGVNVSVSLYFHDLIIVGIPAARSASIANESDKIAFFVMSHITIAIAEIIPQAISKDVIFQYAFL